MIRFFFRSSSVSASFRANLALLAVFVLCVGDLYAQDSTARRDGFGSRIFLPSVELGYMIYDADALGSGTLLKTSLEYRVRKFEDVFVRINFDNRDADYELQQNGFTSVVEGKARFTDLLGGFGYRFGEKKTRLFALGQGGLMWYNFPVLGTENGAFQVRESGRRMGLLRFSVGAEYYIDANSAFTLEVIQSSVLDQRDFWSDATGSWGISVGVIAALF